jgi:hydrogenase 3 maturation protease
METNRTSKPSWKQSLRQALSRLEKPERALRIAVVGIGNELRGDDAAGLLVAGALIQRQTQDARQATDNLPRLLALEGGAAPENVTGALRRFAPDLVVFVDAAFLDAGAPPGVISWLDWRETAGPSARALSASTHTLPLHVIAQYLASELSCEVALIGIQPNHLAFDRATSQSVRQAAQEVAAELWAVVAEGQP